MTANGLRCKRGAHAGEVALEYLVSAENFYQHTGHYFRVDNARRESNQQGPAPRPTTPADVEMNPEADSREVDVDRFEPPRSASCSCASG
jgi:hypothetical protein